MNIGCEVMNNLVLLLPNNFLRRYVLNNFSSFSLEEFNKIKGRINIPSYIYQRNDIINKNSEVLSYALDKDIHAFKYFSLEAFSKECISKIAKSKVEIYPTDIDKHPILLNNEDIRCRVISSFPHLVKKLTSNQITNTIIKILENTYYEPDLDDILKNSLFLKSAILAKRIIKKYPDLLVKVPNLSKDLVNLALENGFVPQKEHFILNPQFKGYIELLTAAFKNDPSIIVFYEKKHLTGEVIYSACTRGYVASESDLLENPYLCDISQIMEIAIAKNPQLIKYVSDVCNLSYQLVVKTLTKYEITKEDILKNPALARNYSIMYNLPQFNLYSAFLLPEEKSQIIVEHLKNNKPITTDTLPFLDYRFGGNSDINNLSKLIQKFQLSINEDDINIQERFHQILNKVIDGIIELRYIQNKCFFKYTDIVSLNETILNMFVSIKNESDDLMPFIYDIYYFLGETLSFDYLKNQIYHFYEIYKINNYLDLSLTSNFCNEILNQHRNYYMSTQKSKILRQLSFKLSLSKKKEETILNRRKLNKVSEYIKSKDFDKLKMTELEFIQILEKLKEDILNSRMLKKSGVKLPDENLDILINYFFEFGNISNEIVCSTLEISNFELIKFITSRFEQLKFKIASKVELTQDEMIIHEWDKKYEGITPIHYKIMDNERLLVNMSKLILQINDFSLNKILSNNDLLGEITYLLPLVDLIDELNLETFIKILANYEHIKIKMTMDKTIENSQNYILDNIADLIILAEAYNSIDDITLFSLGKNIVKDIGENDSIKYLEFYKKMLNRHTSFIPPINLQSENYILESGMFTDPKRLLIGKMFQNDSCIDLLNSAGVKTYSEVLLENSADVILVSDEQRNLVSRILIFRRGNVIQMVTRSKDKFPIKLYQDIANQIIQQSTNDNIDYIFVNGTAVGLSVDDMVEDNRFISKFPHADFSNRAFLLYSKNSNKLDFSISPKAIYEKPRMHMTTSPSENMLTRLRALDIVLEKDLMLKEEKARNFEPFYMKEYKMVICGEDWYIAITKDGNIEKLMLPSTDLRIFQEIENAEQLLGISKGVK